MGLPTCIALAYARPKMMRRVVQTCGQFGIEHLVFYRSYLCEKSYELSQFYEYESVLASYCDGLSQTGIANEPAIEFFDSFKPFLEDFTFQNFEKRQIAFLDPDGKVARDYSEKELLIFGPERGFTDRERHLIRSLQLDEIRVGDLHLRLETAVPYILGAFTSAF